MTNYADILTKFDIDCGNLVVKPLGHGRVNHTFEICCDGGHYVLQEINHLIFKYPTEVMNNLFQVTEYMRWRIAEEGGDPNREAMTFLRTRGENNLLQTEEGNFFRVYRMVENGSEMEKPSSPKEAFEAASALGKFQHLLHDFPAERLSMTFPDLHNLRRQMSRFLDAVRADICFRTSYCQEQIHFVLDHSDRLYIIENELDTGSIPRRVTHNDPGYNNVLVDDQTKEALCLIDLDTVMTGASVFDFGDAVRMGAASVNELDRTGDIELDLDLYRAYLEGYLKYMGPHLTSRETDLLGYSVWVASMERGIRYLTAYLNGEWNEGEFSDDKQNLFAAVNQFFLVLDIEDKHDQMEQILAEVKMSMGLS